MKRFRFYAILLAVVTFVSCSDDFEPLLITDLETSTYVFDHEGGQQSFLLESNEQWSVDAVPEWLTVEVVNAPVTRGQNDFYESGQKKVTIVVSENTKHQKRSVELLMISVSGEMAKLTIEQAKKPELLGYWILSEGYAGQGNAEIAWFDVKTGELQPKQFKEINGEPLGDTGNELKVYGSKMYAVISGPGFGTDTPEGASYIEVINPKNGKSIKRVQFTTADGVAAKPRNIIFEDGKAYISSYSNEVVRLDTASLELEAHATLSGNLAEGLTYNNGNIYVCNSGQGQDNKISVVDAETMVETKVIETAMNPTGIVSIGDEVIYFSTNYPHYTLYKLTVDDETIMEIPDITVADMTYINESIYACAFDWGTYMGEVNQFNISTTETTKLNLDLAGAGIPMLMEYHIGTINGSDNLFLSGMGQDVVVFDPNTQEIHHAFETGVPNGSGVVAVYK